MAAICELHRLRGDQLGAEPSNQNAKNKTKRRILTGISSNVLVLGIVSLLTDASSEMIYPIMPLFLTSIGATGLIIGLIEGASETTASFIKVFSGWYSDRYRVRKPFIAGGYTTSSIMKPLLYFATAPWQVLGLRIMERVGKGVRNAPRDALIADSTDKTFRGRAFGFHKAMDSTGAVIGPLLTIMILLSVTVVTTDTFRTIFLISAVPALVAVPIILLLVREKRAEPTRKLGEFFAEARQLGRPFYLLLIVVMSFYIGEISYAFFILKASESGATIGHFEVDISVILLYVLFNVTFVIVALLSGEASDRLGRKPVIAFSFVVFAVACVVMTSAELAIELAVGFALFGVYKGTSEGVLKAYVTDVAPKHTRGTALGAFHTAVGVVLLPGGVIAGLLWDSPLGPAGTFAYGGIMSVIALVLLLVVAPGREVQVS